MVVALNIIFEALHIPKVTHPNYPSCQRLRKVSKDELSSLFCETPSSWGDRQNTSCSTFAKGPRILNMAMTFILHPLSHYNTITEPRARILLSFMEDLSINFPSHFILSFIDVYKDTMTRDKLIFHFAIMRPQTKTAAPPTSIAPSISAPFSSIGGVTFEAIMTQLVHMDAHLDTLSDELCQVNIVLVISRDDKL